MMASEKTLNCSPCDYKHETKTAVKWCTDCTEALCLTCFEAHKSFKVSRNHNVISIEDSDALKGILLDISEARICEQHDKPSEYFCTLHDDVVCIECIQTKHCQCTGWLPISEAANGVKASVAKETIQKNLDDTIENIEELIDSHKKEQLSNQNVSKSLKEDASKIAQSMIQKVKDLEAELYKTLDVQQHDISVNVGNRADKLQDTLQKIKKLRDRLNSFESYASETQIFLAIRKTSKELSVSIDEIKSESEAPITEMKELQLATPVKSFLSEVTLLCHIKNDSKQIAFRPTKLHQPQSRVTVPVSKSIEDIEIQNIVKIHVFKSEPTRLKIWSAVILPFKQLIFNWDDSKTLVIYNADGKLFRYQPLKDNVTYMAIIDSERLAFSYKRSKEVDIFNMQTLQTEKKITFNEVCFGLSYDGRNLYTVGQTVIACVDLLDDHVRITPVQVNVENVFHLSANGDNLDYADKAKDTVICCQKNGAEIWSFKNDVMKFPNGITSDQYGNTYVACTNSNNVLIISADGKHHKEILNASDGLAGPRAICYDKIENHLLVCNTLNGQAFLCSMK